jgi:hypothetical protein
MVSECNLKLIIFTSVGMRVLWVTYDRKQLSTWMEMPCWFRCCWRTGELTAVLCPLLVMCTPEWCLQISARVTMGYA